MVSWFGSVQVSKNLNGSVWFWHSNRIEPLPIVIGNPYMCIPFITSSTHLKSRSICSLLSGSALALFTRLLEGEVSIVNMISKTLLRNLNHIFETRIAWWPPSAKTWRLFIRKLANVDMYNWNSPSCLWYLFPRMNKLQMVWFWYGLHNRMLRIFFSLLSRS